MSPEYQWSPEYQNNFLGKQKGRLEMGGLFLFKI